jgi:hypothetical protein
MSVKKDVGMQIKMNTKCFKEIIELDLGNKIDETNLFLLIEFVNQRHDCADFRLISIIKAYMAYGHLLSDEAKIAIKEAMLNFKYWMDEPGTDGMCYWSENHQLLFATCEYLAGQLFLNEVFTNDGNLGKYHKEKAKTKINRWLYNRFTYGFTEWHSNTYYEEDIAPLAVLIDHSDDHDMVQQSKILMDILMFDMAIHSFNGYFVATSGRCYENQKKDPKLAEVNDILKHAFGILSHQYDYSRLSALFLLCKNYQVPKVIYDIAHDKDTRIIKDSMGLDLKEVKNEIKPHTYDDLGMFLWSMEAFTNVESIEMTMDIYNAWNLKENNFLKDLNQVNIPIIRKLRLLPFVVKVLNPATQGVAIERANTYTYKTKDYMLSTAQSYHPKFFGDQQHIWQATLTGGVTIFSTHPGSPMFDDDARNFSPSYWVGNGINPDAIQHEHMLFLIYDLTLRKGYLEKQRQNFVHFYFPTKKMDAYLIEPYIAFCKVNDAYVCIKSSHKMIQKNDEELTIFGKKTGFVVILGNKEKDISFDSFMLKTRSDLFRYKHPRMTYQRDKTMTMKFAQGLTVDGIKIHTKYKRYETPYVNSDRKPTALNIHFNHQSLLLDFKSNIRKETNHA